MAGISKAERERRAAAKVVYSPATITTDELARIANAGANMVYLHALCAALPFSGKPNGQGVISFEDRLADAKVKARLILEASCES